MKITLEDLKGALGVERIDFRPSTESSRFVAYNPPTSKVKFVVMTKTAEDEQFDPTKDVYAVILEGEQWSDYNFACVVTNKAPSEVAFSL